MRLSILFFTLLFFTACGPKDDEKIIGKWYNDQHWFEFHTATEYSGGIGPMVNQNKQECVLEPSEKKLTFYTNTESESYYVGYEFIGTDTLAISNFMNQTSLPVKYYRQHD